jgi:hypothetical protein
MQCPVMLNVNFLQSTVTIVQEIHGSYHFVIPLYLTNLVTGFPPKVSVPLLALRSYKTHFSHYTKA